MIRNQDDEFSHRLLDDRTLLGMKIFSQRLQDSGHVSLDDAPPSPGERRYYRLNAGRPERIELVTNPIFVRVGPISGGKSS